MRAMENDADLEMTIRHGEVFAAILADEGNFSVSGIENVVSRGVGGRRIAVEVGSRDHDLVRSLIRHGGFLIVAIRGHRDNRPERPLRWLLFIVMEQSRSKDDMIEDLEDKKGGLGVSLFLRFGQLSSKWLRRFSFRMR